MNLKNTTGSEDRIFQTASDLFDRHSPKWGSIDFEVALERLDRQISDLGEEKAGLQEENSTLAERVKMLEARIDELEASIT